jgi:hypothetical protein
MSVNLHGAEITVAHARMLKDIPSLLALVQEEIVVSLLH